MFKVGDKVMVVRDDIDVCGSIGVIEYIYEFLKYNNAINIDDKGYFLKDDEIILMEAASD